MSVSPTLPADGLPHDLAAECATLGAIIVDESRLDLVASDLTEGSWYRTAHATIWLRLVEMRASAIPIDERTLISELRRHGELDDVGGPAYVGSMTVGMPRGANVGIYSATVVQTARARQVIIDLSTAAQMAADGRVDAAVDLAARTSDAHRTTRMSDRARLHATRAVDLLGVPAPQHVIEGIASEGSISVFVAESGTGKTFVLLAAAASVSDGVTFAGRRVTRGSVVYVTYEGDAMGTRVRALRDVQGRRVEHVYVIRATSPISPRLTRDGEEISLGERELAACLRDLAATLHADGRPPIVLVVVDTVRASMSGSEDDSGDVSAYLRACRRLMAPLPQAALVLSHHAGWQDGDTQRKRERGSSAWRGNCDVTVYLEAGQYDAVTGSAELTLRGLKSRDGETPIPIRLIRRRVELAETDRHGRPVTSCVIEPDPRTREDRDAGRVAAAEAEARALDLAVLRTIAERPDMATSTDRLRIVISARKQTIGEAVSRLIRRDLITAGRRGEPYSLTPAGRRALAEGRQ